VIGILVAVRPAGGNDPMLMFIAALAELGWIEGKTITIVRRSAELRYDSFPERARELVDLGVDLLVVNAGVTGARGSETGHLDHPHPRHRRRRPGEVRTRGHPRPAGRQRHGLCRDHDRVGQVPRAGAGEPCPARTASP
jgi:hypothetical protein